MNYILLPAFNEKNNIIKILKKIDKIKKNISLKVVLIDDCSADGTFKIIKKNKYRDLIYIKHKKNLGLSQTLETGFKKIIKIAKQQDTITTLDCDNTHPIEIIPTMINEILKKNEIIIASRFRKQSKVNGVNYFRILLSLLAKYLFVFFYPHRGLNDYTCNFRCYKLEIIKQILKKKYFFKNEEFNIAAKILLFIINKKKNVKIKEIPFTLSYQKKIGNSKMKIIKTIILTLRLIFFRKF